MATLAMRASPRANRALAITLLVIAVIAAVAILVAPVLLLHRHYDFAIEGMRDHLERYRRVAAQAPETKKALDTLRAKNARRFFLKNTAPNLAGAELQDIVRGQIENNGGRITTVQIIAPKEDGRFRQIGVNVQLFATTPNLQKILYAIETQQPYLIVDGLTIRPLNAFRGFKPAPGVEPEVSVLLDVVAFSKTEADKP
ncbi:MAG TPA: type II secretion system protein GspM [Casimicrobiaceae bacterium]|jgi:hypothetical protein